MYICMFLILWILAGATTAKLDAVMTGNKTCINLHSIFVYGLFWYFGAIYLITCKHKLNNSKEWDY